jgi:hypothetical protein
MLYAQYLGARMANFPIFFFKILYSRLKTTGQKIQQCWCEIHVHVSVYKSGRVSAKYLEKDSIHCGYVAKVFVDAIVRNLLVSPIVLHARDSLKPFHQAQPRPLASFHSI